MRDCAQALCSTRLEEERGGDRSSAAGRAEILEIGERRLELLLVLLRERHLPEELSTGGGRRLELAVETLVVTPLARVLGPEGDDACARERRDVDDGVEALVAAERLGVDERVGEGEHLAHEQRGRVEVVFHDLAHRLERLHRARHALLHQRGPLRPGRGAPLLPVRQL